MSVRTRPCTFTARLIKASADYRRLERRNNGNGIRKGISAANFDAIKDAEEAARKRGLPNDRLTIRAIISIAAAVGAHYNHS